MRRHDDRRLGHRWHFLLSHLFVGMAAGGAILATSRVTEPAQLFAAILAIAAAVALWAVLAGRPA
jgi:hypothetical protein